jgi:hypothetical protein
VATIANLTAAATAFFVVKPMRLRAVTAPGIAVGREIVSTAK